MGNDGAYGSRAYQTLSIETYSSNTTRYTVLHVKLTFPRRPSWELQQPAMLEAVNRTLFVGRKFALNQMAEQHRNEIPAEYFSRSAAASRGSDNPSEGVLVIEGDLSDPNARAVGYLELAIPDSKEGLLPFERRIGRRYRRPELNEAQFVRLDQEPNLRLSTRIESIGDRPLPMVQGVSAELEKFARSLDAKDDIVPLLFYSLQRSWHSSYVPVPFLAQVPGYRSLRRVAKARAGEGVGINQFFIHSLPVTRLMDYYQSLGFRTNVPHFETLPRTPLQVDDPIGEAPKVLVVNRAEYVAIAKKMNLRRHSLHSVGEQEGIGMVERALDLLRRQGSRRGHGQHPGDLRKPSSATKGSRSHSGK